MRTVWITIATACLLGTAQASAQPAATAAPAFLEDVRAEAVERWEDDIRKLEQLDQSELDPPDAILLLGSSSIRLWEDAQTDMAPYRIIRRGYGGAKFSDLAVFAKRLIQPHQYRAAVIFVGNDVSGTANDHTPDQVEQWVRYIVSVSRTHQPESPILLVEVTPTPRRIEAWPEIRDINARLREIALTEPNTYFVATAEHYLDNRDQPIARLFREDRLHQNQDGYAIWSGLIRQRLDEVFRKLAKEQAAANPLD